MALSLEFIAFGGISILTVILALFIVFAKDQARAILYLAFFFVSIASIYLLLGAQYIAIIQVTVYAGGVVVLFIFAIHVTRPDEFRVRGNIKRNILIAAPLGLGMLAVLFLGILSVIGIDSTPDQTGFDIINQIDIIGNLGSIVFNQQVISFVAVGLLLFATLISAVSLIAILVIHDPEKMAEEEQRRSL
ncbi:MAG: NADH-quinone oxidoreductase subunit J [Candidatus Odinarchaeota archaeon]